HAMTHFILTRAGDVRGYHMHRLSEDVLQGDTHRRGGARQGGLAAWADARMVEICCSLPVVVRTDARSSLESRCPYMSFSCCMAAWMMSSLDGRGCLLLSRSSIARWSSLLTQELQLLAGLHCSPTAMKLLTGGGSAARETEPLPV
ncbi:hypothetical protein Dimus_016444, partial [Dionaea muscipula]